MVVIYAESAIVFAQSKSIDNDLKIKMRIENNLVYNNMNRLPFYLKSVMYRIIDMVVLTKIL